MIINKKILLISSVLLTLIIMISIVFVINKNNTDKLVLEKKEEIKTQISGFNGLSLMYETGPGTGEYQESKSSTWPEEGYIFNENLSACENGGKLSWNEEKKAVILNSFGSDACYVYFDAYIIPVINSVSTSNITNDSITLTVNATNGNNPITTYYYSSNNGSNYIESTSNTYTFNNLEMGTEYNFSVYVKDSLGYESKPYTLSETTDNVTYICDSGTNLATCIKNQYTSQGSNGIYYHTSSLANSAADNSYRYAGANPNNYVCFGDDCSDEDNLYRIIGVFGSEVKLIKWDYANSNLLGTSGAYNSSAYSASGYSSYKGAHSSVNRYYWNNSTNNNTWSQSNLNTTNLNTTYLNSLGSTWSNKISNHNWKVGGGTYQNLAYGPNGTPKNAYNYEVGSNSSSTTYSAKIGLMYVSDYYYGASPTYWTYPGYTSSGYPNSSGNYGSSYDYRAASGSNWMYMGLYEWTISRSSSNSGYAFGVYYTGLVYNSGVSGGNGAVRPSFYLESSTSYVSGSGTADDPIHIQ